MRVSAIFRKEVIHIKRDKRILYFSIIWPVLLLLLFGYAVNMDVKNIDVSFIDLDGTEVSRGLFQRLKNIGSFKLTYGQTILWKNIEDKLKQGRYRAVIIIPDGFSKKLLRHERPQFQILVDGSDNNAARILIGYLSEGIEDYFQRLLRPPSMQMVSVVNLQFHFLYNPSLRSQNFIVPGLIAIIIMIICTLITSAAIAGEWERGTMEQLLYTPVRSYELIIGKLLPYLIIGFIQVTLVLLTGIIVFKVPFKGSIILFYIASALYIFSALGLGLFISLQTKNQQVSTMIAFLVSILPAFLLSGFVFPINNMPVALQIVTNFVPARYFLHIIRNIFLKGTTLFQCWQEFTALLIFCLVFLCLGIMRFKKRLS
ncbi:MAG: ABC transporter permease [bacterium]